MATNIFTEAKKYQRMHPKTPWQTCIQKVKGKVGKKAAPAKKKTASVGAKKKTIVKKKVVVNRPANVRISGTVGSALKEFNRATVNHATEAQRLEQMKRVGLIGKSATEKATHRRAIDKQKKYVGDLKKNANNLKKYL